jgi:GNAT superfamily N-acetyltransferase
MRLLALQDHKDKSVLHAQMHKDFLQEQEQNSFIDNSHQTFLIEHENQVIGFAQVELEEECFPDEDLPEICMKMHAFYIQPEFRGKTLGRQAFKLLRQRGRDNRAALIETTVHKALDFSHEFLKEQGLELVGSGQGDLFRGFI